MLMFDLNHVLGLPTTSRVLLLAAAFSATTINALPQGSGFGSRPTITYRPPYSNSRSLSPRSTAADISPFGTWPESTVNAGVCGWIGGDPYSPVTCDYGNICVWDSANGVVGCCPDSGSCTGSETGIYTSCVDSSNPQAVVSPNVMSCPGTSQCYENSYPGGYIQYNCGASTDATTIATAIPRLAVSLVPMFTSLLFPASTSASLTSTSSPASTSPSTSRSSSSSSPTSSAKITPSLISSVNMAASPTATLAAITASSSGTQTGKIVGIVLGVVIGVALLAFLAACFYRRRSNPREGAGRYSGVSVASGFTARENFLDPYHSALTSIAQDDSTKVDYGRGGERMFGSGDRTLGGEDMIDTIASTPLIEVSPPAHSGQYYDRERQAGIEAFGNSELGLSPSHIVTTITANTSPVRENVSPLSRTISNGLDFARSISSQSLSAIFGNETMEEMARAKAARPALESRRPSAVVAPLNIRPTPPRKSSKRKFFQHVRRPSTAADSLGPDLSMIPSGLSSIATSYSPLDGVGSLENVGVPIDGLGLGLIGAGAGAMDYRPGTASTAASGTVGSLGLVSPGLPPGATTRMNKLSPGIFSRPVGADVYDPHPGTRLDRLSIGSIPAVQRLSVMDGVGTMAGAGLMPMRGPSNASMASSLNQGCRPSIRRGLEREGLVDMYTKNLVESLDGGAGLAADAASLYGREEIFNTSTLGYGSSGYGYGSTHYGIGMRDEKEGLLANIHHMGNPENVDYGAVEGIVHPALRTSSDSRRSGNKAARLSAARLSALQDSTAKEEESGSEMRFGVQDGAQNAIFIDRVSSLPRSARVELSSAGSGLTGRTTSDRTAGNASEGQIGNRQVEMTSVPPAIWGFTKVGERAPGERGEIGGSNYSGDAHRISGGSTKVPVLRKPVPGAARESLRYDV